MKQKEANAALKNPKPAAIQYSLAHPKQAVVVPELPKVYSMAEPSSFRADAAVDIRSLLVPSALTGAGTGLAPKKCTLFTVAFNALAYVCVTVPPRATCDGYFIRAVCVML